MDLQEKQGLAYLFITHDLSVVKHISNRIMVMYMGVMVEYAETDELFDHPQHPYTQGLLSAIQMPDLSVRNRKRVLLKGEVSSPINPKPGCRFAPRCPYARDICSRQEPQEIDIGGRRVSCHLRTEDKGGEQA